MRRIVLVAQREYLQNVRTKGFWFGVLFFPVILTVFIVAPRLIDRARSARQYAVVDRSGWLLAAIDRRVAGTDLGYVFQETLERQREGGEEFARLPDLLKDLAPTLAELEPGQVFAFARQVVARADDQRLVVGAEPLAESAERVVVERGRAVLDWWRERTPSEAKALTSRVSASRYARVATPAAGDEQIAELNRRVRDGELFAYFVIGPDPQAGSEGSRYVSSNLTDEDLRDWFGFNASEEVRARRLADQRIDPEVASWIQEPIAFEARTVTETGEERQIEERDTIRQWAPVVFVYLLWISVWSVSNMLMMGTVEEKSSRVIEVLLSSVSPVELLAGKIVGIAATGLTLVVSWLACFFVGTKFLPQLMGAPPTLDLAALATDPVFILSFLAYFLLGYLLYAAILVGLGSLCNTVSDAQNMLPAVMLFLFVPLLTMVPIGRDPNGTLAQVLSFFPPFTPFVMMNRAAGPPTTLEYVLTSALLIVSILGALWTGAKIFRIGILLTGKPPKLREIVRWLRAPVGMVPVRRSPRT